MHGLSGAGNADSPRPCRLLNGRSDLVRRAMAKKKVSVMEQERKNFIYGIDDDNGIL